jgi:transposase
MYLRHATKRTKGGKRTYWTLVRSVRRGTRVVQEIVANLGRLDPKEVREAAAIARHFLGPKANQPQLFEDTQELGPEHVHIGKVRVEHGRAFGDVWLAWVLWRALELDDFCNAHMPRGREAVPWAEIASILAIARLCEPSSELHIAEDWYRKTALSDLIGVAASQVHHTRLYQGLDQLLEHKVELQRHIKERMGALFSLNYDLMLYDVTSTYFEGECGRNPMARRGYSRDGRGDCKQICIGLVVSREGYPVGYEVFDGNRVDVTTVEEIVEEMERRYGKAGRVWVMDRGMASEANLDWLRTGDRRYLVGTPRTEMKRWAQELSASEGWKHVRDGLQVKQCEGPGGKESFLLCRSRDREAKEHAMHERATNHIREELGSLGRRLKHARRPVDIGGVNQQIGRILERHSRAARRFDIKVVYDLSRKSEVRLTWRERKDWRQWMEMTEGTYVLRTNVNDWTDEELWHTYVQLWQAEAAFRVHKSDLSIRPIWHHKAERVQAHLLVCFLAFCMWKALEGWQARASLGSSPRKLLDELKRIQTVDVVIPVVNGPKLRLRCVMQPDEDLGCLLERLGLRLPERLRIPDVVDADVVGMRAAE